MQFCSVGCATLAVLQQINDEEEKEKLKKRKRWWVRQALRGASSSAHFML